MNNLVIFTCKIDTLIVLIIFLKKYEKGKEDLYVEMEGVNLKKCLCACTTPITLIE